MEHADSELGSLASWQEWAVTLSTSDASRLPGRLDATTMETENGMSVWTKYCL